MKATRVPSRSSDSGLAVDVLDASPFIKLAADAGCWLKDSGDAWVEWGTKSEVTKLGRSLVYAYSKTLAEPPQEYDGESEDETRLRKRLESVHKKLGTSAGKNSVAADMESVARAEVRRHVYISSLDSEAHILWAGGHPCDLLRSTEEPVLAESGYSLVHRLSAAYFPDIRVKTPRWNDFLKALWPAEQGSYEVRDWAVREIAAVALWGATSKRHPVLYGPPGTGKSTFASKIKQLLGSYAVQVSPDALIGPYAQGSATEEQKYRMLGARLVWMDEPPPPGKQSISQFNELASGDGDISASRKYSNEVTAAKKFNFLICENPRNALNREAEGVKERLNTIPSEGDSQAVGVARDAMLAAFETEAPGILARLIVECARHHNGDVLEVPWSVLDFRQRVLDRGNDFKAWLLENYTLLPADYPLKERTVTIDTIRRGYNDSDIPRGARLDRATFRERLADLGVHVAPEGVRGGPNSSIANLVAVSPLTPQTGGQAWQQQSR